MSRPETLQKKYMGRLAKSALLFMKSLLCMDPELRPNTLASLNHPYFEDLNQQQQMMQQQQMEAKRERQQQQLQQPSSSSQMAAATYNAPVPTPSPRGTAGKINSRSNQQTPTTAESKVSNININSNSNSSNRENVNSMNQSKVAVNSNNAGKKPSSRDNISAGVGIAELKRQYNNGTFTHLYICSKEDRKSVKSQSKKCTKEGNIGSKTRPQNTTKRNPHFVENVGWKVIMGSLRVL